MEAKRNNSKKRRAILETLAMLSDHPTAEMLYLQLKPDFPELSLGTVYRNLKILAEEGRLITVAHVAGEERYDARLEPHAHFICRGCNKVMDLELPDISGEQYRSIEQRSGCCPESHRLNFYGLCRQCKESNSN